MITPTSEQRLQLLFPHSNRALQEALRHATPEQRELLNSVKGLDQLLALLTGKALESRQSDTLLLDLLRNSPAFRQLGSFTDTLGSLLQNLRSEAAFSELHAKLQAYLDHGITSAAGLKRQLSDSGVFLESKLLAAARIGESSFADDVKALLLQLRQALQHSDTPGSSDMLRQAERLLLQIDYHQLYSYLSDASVLYFPYAWDLLEEGSLAFRRGKERTYHCRVELRLKAFGVLQLLISLADDTHVTVRAHAESEALVGLLRGQLPALRAALRRAGLVSDTIEISARDGSKRSAEGYGSDGRSDTGFEVRT